MKQKPLLVLGLIITVLTASCNRKIIDPRPETGSNKVVLDWNLAAYEAMGGATYQHSLLAARVNAMVHIAMHDALNAIGPAFETYSLQTKDYQAEPISAAAS